MYYNERSNNLDPGYSNGEPTSQQCNIAEIRRLESPFDREEFGL